MFSLPDTTRVNKFIPKTRFYERGIVSTRVKDVFQQDIKRITWSYKISEATHGAKPSKKIEEIQIFTIELKNKVFPQKALEVIVRSIQYPILFVLEYEGSRCFAIKPLTQDYFLVSNWEEEVLFDFNGLHLETIYEKIIKQFIIEQDQQDKDIEKALLVDKHIRQLKKEIEVIKKKIKREQQFKKKVEYNQKLHNKKNELEDLLKHH